jgi:hypothetical protein
MTLFNNIVDAQDSSSVSPCLSTISSWFTSKDVSPIDARSMAVTLLDYVKSERVDKVPRVPHVEFNSNNTYTFNVNGVGDQPVKPSMHQFMTPLMPEGYNPTMETFNFRVGIKERIVRLVEENKTKEPLPPRYKGIEDAFIMRFLNGRTFTPLEVEDVLLRQNTAKKLAKMSRADQRLATGHATAFSKRQCEGKIAPSRVITESDQGLKRDFQRYVYPLQDYMAEHLWYMFKTPRILSERMEEMVRDCGHVIAADLSKCDGRHSYDIKRLIQKLYARAFNGDEIVLELFQKTFDRWVWYTDPITGESDSFWSGPALGSGSPDTSLENSFFNVFFFFCSLVELGYSYDRAWGVVNKHAGVGGDDSAFGIPSSISTNTSKTIMKNLVRSAKYYGQVSEAELAPRGTPFKFLARWWNPWFGDLSSMCDLPRSIGKLHMTADRQCDPLTKLKEKAMSVYVTDRNSPFIGEWAKGVLAALSNPEIKLENPESYWAGFGEAEGFISEFSDWMQEIAIDSLVNMDCEILREHIVKCMSDPRKLLKFPVCIPARPLEVCSPAIMNDQYLPKTGGNDKDVPATKTESAKNGQSNSPSSSDTTTKSKPSAKPTSTTTKASTKPASSLGTGVANGTPKRSAELPKPAECGAPTSGTKTVTSSKPPKRVRPDKKERQGRTSGNAGERAGLRKKGDDDKRGDTATESRSADDKVASAVNTSGPAKPDATDEPVVIPPTAQPEGELVNQTPSMAQS